MKLSARNVLSGKVVELTEGAVNVEVVIEVAPDVQLVSIITKHACEALGLKVGSDASAVVKASNVMIATA